MSSSEKSSNSPSEHARIEIWSSGVGCDGAKVHECCLKRDSIIEICLLVFVISVCICCKVCRIESKDFCPCEGAGLRVFRLLGGLSLGD